MRSLFKAFDLVDLNLSYDGITIYPNHDLMTEGQLGLMIDACMRVIFFEIPGEVTKEGKTILRLKNALTESDLGYERAIAHSDDDHDFYHSDVATADRDHFHLKFHSMLTRHQFMYILNTMVEYDLLPVKEKDEFVLDFDDWFLTERLYLSTSLVKEQKADTKAIIHYINQCENNEIIADLHEYLLTNKYDYLRAKPFWSFFSKKWQGSNQDGAVEETSYEWAMIEKAMTLQMAKNVHDHVSRFTENVAQERARQLKEDHSFFAIKRKAKNAHSGCYKSQLFRAFSHADERALEDSHTRHFQQFS